jgi:hypothetical protein
MEASILKILLTGGTSSQTHETTKRQPETLVGLMARALRDRGHEVYTRAFSVRDIETDDTGWDNAFDFAFVGQSPLRGLGSSYCYGALAAQHRFRGKCAIFTDDTDTKKMRAEWLMALKKPADFVKPFWHYKRDWETARSRAVLPRLLEQIEWLIGDDASTYPQTFVPGWTYNLAFRSGVQLSPHARLSVRAADPSKWTQATVTRTIPDENERYWASCWRANAREVQKMGMQSWAFQEINRLTWKELGSASGLLAPSAAWSPEVRLAVESGVPVATEWRVMGPQFGEPFESLAANMEEMKQNELDDLAAQQKAALTDKGFEKDEFPNVLEDMINKTLEAQ